MNVKLFDIESFSDAIENSYKYKEGEEPVKFFIEGLDTKQYGLYRGEPNVIMARSGRGKSTFMLNITAKNIAHTKNKFMILSQEMNKQAIIRRTLAIVDDSYESQWREYNIKSEDEFNQVKKNASKIAQELDDRFFISSQTYTLSDLLKAIDYALLNDFDGIFVDYFQLVEYDLKGSVFSEAEKMKQISKQVTAKIKDTKLMFCWLAQVMEQKDDREDYIKGTSQLKNDAAGILNVFVDKETETGLKMQVQKDRNNGNESLEVEVAFNKGKQRIGEFEKGRLLNKAISRETSINGVTHRPINQQPVKAGSEEDDMPFF